MQINVLHSKKKFDILDTVCVASFSSVDKISNADAKQ